MRWTQLMPMIGRPRSLVRVVLLLISLMRSILIGWSQGEGGGKHQIILLGVVIVVLVVLVAVVYMEVAIVTALIVVVVAVAHY